jgi:hypothetical protein
MRASNRIQYLLDEVQGRGSWHNLCPQLPPGIRELPQLRTGAQWQPTAVLTVCDTEIDAFVIGLLEALKQTKQARMAFFGFESVSPV